METLNVYDVALTHTYDSNSADALTAATDSSTVHNSPLSTTTDQSYSYGYDGAGNFTSISAGSTGHMVDSVPGSVNNVGEYANFTYNARHDLTNDGTYTYGYDALDRLISVTPDSLSAGSTQEQYGYDSQGRMQWEDVSTWNGSAWTLSNTYHFLWSGDELIAKLDGNNNLLQQYTWGTGQNGTDQVLAITDYTGSSPQTFALIYDASGDVTMMVDAASGTIVANYQYDPYGRLLSSSGPDAGLNPFLSKGYWTDSNVPGLAWAQPAIDYGTTHVAYLATGVWMQDDPSGINGGVNPTEYVGDDPINNVDPNGLAPTPDRQILTPYLNNALQAIQQNPKALYNSGQYNAPTLLARLVFYDSWASIGNGVSQAYTQARAGLGNAAAATNLPAEKALYNSVSIATYPMEVNSYGAVTYSQVEATGLGAISRLSYVKPLATFVFTSLGALKAIEVGNQLTTPQGRANLQVTDFADAGLGMLGFLHVIGPETDSRPATVLDPIVAQVQDELAHSGVARNPVDVALGHSRVAGNLSAIDDFAAAKAALSYKQWPIPEGALGFPDVFRAALQNTLSNRGTIHFALDGVDVRAALAGDAGKWVGRYTDWELQQIVDNPTYIKSTKFYLGGRELSVQEEVAAGIKR